MNEKDKLEFHSWARTDIGNVRDTNEDSFLVDDDRGLYAVADGVGGRLDGEVASNLLVETVEKIGEDLEELNASSDPVVDKHHRERLLRTLRLRVQEANGAIFRRGGGEMGTTADVLLLSGEAAYLAHVGDSRVYLLRDDRIYQLTHDHTFAEELRSSGPAVYDEAYLERYSHVLSRSIGTRPRVDVDTLFVDVQVGDRFLLCSDGVTDYLEEDDIVAMAQEIPVERLAGRLIDRAKKRGGHDNLTAILVEAKFPIHDTVRDFSSVATFDTMRKITFLEQIDLFEGLEDQDFVKIIRIVYRRTFSDGEIIVRKGEPAGDLYMILDGEISLQVEGEEIARLEPGEHFGEMSLIDHQPRSADAVALGETVLLVIPGDRFENLVRNNEPELGNRLLWNLLKQASKRVRATTRDMVDGK